jgi:cell division protein FtsI (penicillin-binding protein 3)
VDYLEEDRRKAVTRLAWLAGGVVLWGVAILAKLVSLQVIHHNTYLLRARMQQETRQVLAAPRGKIEDRNGVLLAVSIPVDSVSVNPKRLPDPRAAAELIGPVLSMDVESLYQQLKLARQKNHGYLLIKHKISPSESARLRDYHLDWIDFKQDSRRLYPNGMVGSHVIGSVFKDEEGSDGIEKGLDRDLKGHEGAARMLTDVKRRGIDQTVVKAPQDGQQLRLTIDSRIQYIAERELDAAAEAHHAVTGAAIVMNPHTGEILALANWPAFDPNEAPVTKEQQRAHRNLGLSVPFEPGSIFKVITIAAAMETTNLTPTSRIDCHNGFLALPGRVVHEAHRGFGMLTVSEVLEKSSNIGAIGIGAQVGAQRMYDYVRKFGFGQRTGLPLPAESPGLLRKLNRWGTTSLASISMGQEVSTTSVQLARACSVVANGGFLVQPTLVSEHGGVKVTPAAPHRVIKEETAATMRVMMEGVVLRGTGKAARLSGYTSGGKTGTAQIFDVATHHYTKTYNASFMGFTPVSNPALVIVVTLNGTTGNSGMGGAASAPAFHNIATEALRLLDVPKDLAEDVPVLTAKNDAKTDVSDLAVNEFADAQTNILEEDETAQPAVIPAMSAPGTAPVVTAAYESGPHVPDLRGMTMRSALAEASQDGFALSFQGSGLVRAQSPPPGAVLHPGQNVRVRLKR